MIDIKSILEKVDNSFSVVLYSPIIGKCRFNCIDEFGNIEVQANEKFDNRYFSFDKYGRYILDEHNRNHFVSEECMLRPINLTWKDLLDIQNNYYHALDGTIKYYNLK